MEKVITRKQAADNLNCSTKTVDRLIKENRIRAFKLGRKVLIYEETISEKNINAIRPNFLN
jgi:excisionase family DNA binding protein